MMTKTKEKPCHFVISLRLMRNVSSAKPNPPGIEILYFATSKYTAFYQKLSLLVKEADPVTIEIFNVMGKKVKTLLNKNVTTGEYQISWDGKNDSGSKLLPGMYLCTLRTAQHASTRRILVN